MSQSNNSPPRSFRIDDDLIRRLDRHVAVATLMKGEKLTRTGVVTEALNAYLTEFETHLASVYESIDEANLNRVGD